MDIVYSKYLSHKQSAKQRGVEFTLTFEEWKSIWGEHIANRGKDKGMLVMARTLDKGGYSPGNVRIATHSENAKEAVLVKTRELVRDSGIDQRWVMKRHNVFDEYIEEED